jgi:plasmid maintenance system antidote protein VapI/Zn-dependent peptidase ImmA (M78 family)
MTTTNQYYPESVTHPSVFLREALEERMLGPKEFAIKTGKPEKTITAVLNGLSSITSDMAILFEQVLKIPAHFWIEAQKNYDEYKARINYQKRIAEAGEWARSFPYAQMAKFGWVKPTRKLEEKVIELFTFFEVASQKGFEDYYYNQKTRVAFRISLKNQKNATAIASWLRQGEIQAEQITAPEFDKGALKKSLPKIKAIMARHPANFFDSLKNICLEAGVKVVHTPCLPNAPIHGSTRWVKENPLIQLSGRYKRNDIFWFTFFHEVGHVLLHGKKYVSIENIDVEGELEAYEKQADEFAAERILSPNEEKELLKHRPLNPDSVRALAQKFGTHPACIIGRLQHKGLIRYGLGTEFFEPVEF